MYYLEQKPAYFRTASLQEVKDAVALAQEALADSSRGLTFDEKEHRYYLHGQEMPSVSSIVEHFAPFDSLAMATKCSINPKHEYFGRDPQEIVAIWAANGRAAAQAGTDVHAFGEACALYIQGRTDEIDEQFRRRITPDGLRAETPKEEAVAQWWNDQDWWRYTVVAKETRVVNPLLGYAGTFDLLLYDILEKTFHVRDYKTNKDLERWFGNMLLPPLSMLRGNDIGKYTVQQTAYTIQLRNVGLDVRSNELVWLREDGYRVVSLPMGYEKVITYAISTLKNQ